MSKIVIFSGTSEGREISEALSLQKTEHIVCVATKYGSDVMTKSDYSDIHTGRMNEEEMEAFLREEACLVIDATHPYADIASANIFEAARRAGIRYLRVKRNSIDFAGSENLHYIDGEDELPELLNKTDGNILFTTGTKLLSGLTIDEAKKNHVYVRVIPSVESIEACLSAGIPVKNIIAMQGPFSVKMNETVIREYGISCLITKESGAAGGFPEKLEAAGNMGCEMIIIGRPSKEEGLSVSEVLDLIGCNGAQKRAVDIALIGMGMGKADTMTIEAKKAVNEAQIVFGPARMLGEIKHKKVSDLYRAADILPVIMENGYSKVAVVFSGDSGFYSGAVSFKRDMKTLKEGNDCEADIRIIPGISSVSYLASRVGRAYSGAFVYSLHGKKGSPEDIGILAEGIYTHEDTFVLLSGDEDVRIIGRILSDNPERYEIILGSNLSYEDERLTALSVDEAGDYSIPGLYTAYIHNKEPLGRKIIPYIEDEEFIRNDTPMTKEIIRHEIVRLLNIREGSTVFDIGSGTGSVSIEAASLHPSVKVYAVEINPDACECMRKNIDKFACSNIELIEGDAADIVAGLPESDAVFIGGSKGKLAGIIDKIPKKKNGTRVVITAVTLETTEQILELKKNEKVTGFKMSQIQVTDLRQAGAYNLMGAQNPVFIASFNLV